MYNGIIYSLKGNNNLGALALDDDDDDNVSMIAANTIYLPGTVI